MNKGTLMLAAIVVGVCSSIALAGGPLGPPGSTVPQGEWVIDGAYFYEEMDLQGWGIPTWPEGRLGITDGNDITWLTDWEPIDEDDDDYDCSCDLLNFETNTWLASLEYGLWENCTVYVRAGIADAQATMGNDPNASNADFGYGFAWQVGSGFTFYRSGPWTFGGRMQFGSATPDSWSWSSTDPNFFLETGEGSAEGTATETGTADLDWWQAVAYLGGTYQVNDSLQLYGGGGWQTLHGTLDYTINGEFLSDDPVYDGDYVFAQSRESGSCRIKHASAIGVFGAGWQPRDNVRVSGEFLFGERGKWGWGLTAAIGIP